MTNWDLLQQGRQIVQAAMDIQSSRGVPSSVPFMQTAEAWMKDTLEADPEPLPTFIVPEGPPPLVHRLDFAGGAIQVATMMPSDHQITNLALELRNNLSGGEQSTRLEYTPDYQVVSR